MGVDYVGYAYALIIASGGIMGYAKKGTQLINLTKKSVFEHRLFR